MLKNSDSLLFKHTEKNFPVIYPIIKQLTQTRGIKLTISPSSKHNKTISGSSMDDEAYEIINTIIKKSHKQLSQSSPVFKKTINPLYLLSDSEIQLYAKIKRMKNPVKKSNSSIITFINQLETKHPEVKNSIVNAFLKNQS